MIKKKVAVVFMGKAFNILSWCRKGDRGGKPFKEFHLLL